MLKFLFLDDEKVRHDSFDTFISRFNDIEVTHTYTYRDTIAALEKENFDLLCLDHDLGLSLDPETETPTAWTNASLNKVKSGADVAEWLAENLNGEFVNVVIHSWNPVGVQNMLDILKDFNVVPYTFGGSLFSFMSHYIPTLRKG